MRIYIADNRKHATTGNNFNWLIFSGWKARRGELCQALFVNTEGLILRIWQRYNFKLWNFISFFVQNRQNGKNSWKTSTLSESWKNEFPKYVPLVCYLAFCELWYNVKINLNRFVHVLKCLFNFKLLLPINWSWLRN